MTELPTTTYLRALATDLPIREADRVRAIADNLDWKLMDTAPKDGTPVLGFVPDYYQSKGGLAVILWHQDGWYDNGAFKTKPTRWMPLPQPPEPAGGGR